MIHLLQKAAPVRHCGLRMFGLRAESVIMLCMLVAEGSVCGQKAPLAADRPWDVPAGQQTLKPQPKSAPAIRPDPGKIYTLSDLVNIAEENNPETRAAWESAKARAAEVGIARAELYPTVAAAALAQSSRGMLFFAPNFIRQTTATFSPAFSLDYIIFDFGRRSAEIDARRKDLLAANFQFNDTHRRIIFQVMQAYYRLLDTKGQEDAAEANLKNAETVQQAAEARLQQGLTTLPDVLEARSAAAQADYDLQAAVGATEIAHGDLATALGVSPTSQFQVESIQNLTMPHDIADTVETSIDKALVQRPDLMQRVAALRAAGSEVRAARKDYYPTLGFNGDAGLGRTYAEQDQLPGVYSKTQELWSARLSLNWTLFDGRARENRIARAEAEQKQAAAESDALRDQVENDVWSAYSIARTSLRQQKAAAALLAAATESYSAAFQSYTYGVRSQIDVVSAQRALAQARTADVSARTGLLTGMAALAFQTGDLLHRKGP